MAREYCWGIDLGGTKIEAIILDPANDYAIVARERVPTNAHLGYESVVQTIKSHIQKMETDTGINCQRLGMGTPGSINPYTRELRNCNSVYLNGHKFQEDLQEVLGIPVRITNDANCFAVSEYKLGIIKEEYPEARVVVGVIMGTGVGSGLVVNGEIINGKNGIGGEWGHNYLDESGGDCYCGKTGCVETILSGPALEKYYASLSGTALKLKEIVMAYREGKDEYAVRTMDRLFHFFPLAISNVINILDPDVIVMGGGLGNIDELYTEGLKKLDAFVFSDYINTEFTRPKFGDSSGVLGAALLFT